MNKQGSILLVGAFPKNESVKIYGGVKTSCGLLHRELVDRGVDVLTLDSTQQSNPPPRFLIRAYFALLRICKFIYLLESQKPSNVLLFTSSGASLIEKGFLAAYARLRNIRAFIFPRSGKIMDDAKTNSVKKWIVSKSFWGSKKILCQGSLWQDFFENFMNAEKSKLTVIENWSATPELLRIGSERSYNSDPSVLQILFVGWLEKAKGVFELVEVIKKVRTIRPIQVTFVGDGNARGQLEALVKKYELQETISFKGWLENEDLSDEYRRADIFSLPSWSEGFPNAMIEAMASGVCVLVTDVGTISSSIIHGTHALIIPPKNPLALEAGLIRLFQDNDLRMRLAKNGYQLAREKWVVQRAADQVISLLS